MTSHLSEGNLAIRVGTLLTAKLAEWGIDPPWKVKVAYSLERWSYACRALFLKSGDGPERAIALDWFLDEKDCDALPIEIFEGLAEQVATESLVPIAEEL